MRIIKQRGPFCAIDIFLEDISVAEIRMLQRTYDRISLLIHHPLEGLQEFRCKHKKTPNIYVTDAIEVVFSRFRDTVRNEINRTLRMPDLEIRIPDTTSSMAFEAYSAFEYSQHRAPISQKEFDVFLHAGAYFQGRFISGVSFFQEHNKLRIRSIYSIRLQAKDMADQQLYKIIGYASKRLIYEICTYAKEHGAILVDLASINLTDPEKESIARFKSGFGAHIEDEYQYIHASTAYRLFEHFATMRARFRVWAFQRFDAFRRLGTKHAEKGGEK